MNWEINTAVAEIIGALAVVASLVYLGLQVRNGAVEDRARTIHDMSVQFSDWQMAIATDPELTKIWVNGVAIYDSLNNLEKAQFILLAGAVVRIQENIFLQYHAGRLDAAVWKPYGYALSSLGNSPGLKAYLKEREGYHSAVFTEVMAEAQQKHGALPKTYATQIG